MTEDMWSQLKSGLKLKNSDNQLISTWVDPINFVEVKNFDNGAKKVILSVPSSLHQYFVLENLMDSIYQEIKSNLKFLNDFEVDVIVQQPTKSNSDLLTKSNDRLIDTAISQNLSNFVKSDIKSVKVEVMNSEYTFSTFVVGKNTEFAHAASFNVSQNPGSEGYNPLFICGPVGMGKTHLLHSVGNHIHTMFPNLRITYISAERFLNECVSAIRRQEMDKFRQKYRENSDILLVDDVQYIGRGEAVQEEFFHTINTFIERKKQVVVASDRMPKDILGLEDRSRSRLEWGLIADIGMPDLETRFAILKYKSEKMGLRLSDEVASYIAKISKRSIRELEGNLKKVKMFSELQGLSITYDLAKKVLINHETQTVITAEEILKLVAEHYSLKVSDVKSISRAKQVVVPRQVCMYLIKKHLDKSLVDIGKIFGGKDHTTVMNAIDRVSFLQAKDLDFKNDIEDLTTRIHNITGL